MSRNLWFPIALLLSVFAHAVAAHGDAAHEKKAFGQQGDPKKASRTIALDMSDAMRFSPAQLVVKQGETVRFRVKNSGKVMHEMVLGTMQELKEHAEMMKKHPGMQHDDEPGMVHVAPGKTQTLVWQFTNPGEFHYGCLIPGHFEAGMVGRIRVLAQAEAISEGEVRRVDKAAKKITLRHGPLQNLDMPGMTMAFQVKDPAMLDQVKVGDKVKFRAEKLDSGFTITRLERAQ